MALPGPPKKTEYQKRLLDYLLFQLCRDDIGTDERAWLGLWLPEHE